MAKLSVEEIKRIWQLRHEKGYTLDEIVKETGHSKPTVARYASLDEEGLKDVIAQAMHAEAEKKTITKEVRLKRQIENKISQMNTRTLVEILDIGEFCIEHFRKFAIALDKDLKEMLTEAVAFYITKRGTYRRIEAEKEAWRKMAILLYSRLKPYLGEAGKLRSALYSRFLKQIMGENYAEKEKIEN